jgi:hypothetical protein
MKRKVVLINHAAPDLLVTLLPLLQATNYQNFAMNYYISMEMQKNLDVNWQKKFLDHLMIITMLIFQKTTKTFC